MSWQSKAACGRGEDPDIFFPEKNDIAAANSAKMICANCTVRPQCKQWKADSNSSDGIWAGERSIRGKK